MSIEIDPAFKKSGKSARARASRRRTKRLVSLGAGIVALIGVVTLAFIFWPERSGDPTRTGGEDGETAPQYADGGDNGDFTLVQTEGSATAGVSAAAAAFIDLARDPMILHFESADSTKRKEMVGPDDLDPNRVGPPAVGRLALVKDELLQAERRLVTTIPSSAEDFAFFQAQRSEGIAQLTDQNDAATDVADLSDSEAAGHLVTVSGDDGSWGALIGGGGGDQQDGEAVYVETRIENTTSVVFALREQQRSQLYRDVIVVLQTERDLPEVLGANGFGEDDTGLIVKAVTRDLGDIGEMARSSIVAMRMRDAVGGGQELLQLSLYSPDGYLGSLASVGAGRYAPGADPWYEDDLLAHSGQVRQQVAAAPKDVRLLDAFYSAAIRNGLSTTLVGELIVVMSQRFDLDRFAAEGDEVTILLSTTPGPGAEGLGTVLYAAINGPSGDMPCYVAAKPNDEGFDCGGATAGGRGHGDGLSGGLIVPVEGTRTSGFGPRMHPILKQLRNHDGIDWAAPTGTPIHAAGAGKIAVAGNGGGYGNVVYIDHGGGVQTRYAHLSRFAPTTRAGAQVAQGDVIGYVGTTGRSTGPHLHFEVRLNGKPVDPASFGGGGGTMVASGGGGGGASGAVEALVNKIIKVESGGRADARNTRSSATGLGQFINSTWLRMMRTYRPDLAQSMSEADLLALRTNPELSREMVRNLARENEAYLRNRGHSITAGRLYLAHFLGPQGADIALRADPNATVLSVMGAGVVNANPFLKGWTVAQMTSWSDRKMSGASGSGGGSYTPAPVITPQLRAYMKLIDTIIDKA